MQDHKKKKKIKRNAARLVQMELLRLIQLSIGVDYVENLVNQTTNSNG